MAPTSKLLVNKRDLAAQLSVSPRCVDYWISEHRIPYIKISARCIRFKPAEVLAALESTSEAAAKRERH